MGNIFGFCRKSSYDRLDYEERQTSTIDNTLTPSSYQDENVEIDNHIPPIDAERDENLDLNDRGMIVISDGKTRLKFKNEEEYVNYCCRMSLASTLPTWSPDIALNKKTECSICWGPFKEGSEIKGMPCSHFFHTKCLDLWFEKSSKCPLCFQDISNY